MAPARATGWAGLLAAAFAASAAGLGWQLAFAAAAIGGLGLAHGASDLAVIAPARRRPFVLAYLLVLVAVMLWWWALPGTALPAFLALSALHFAWEDAGDRGMAAWAVHGLLPVAAPALLHRREMAELLAATGGSAVAAAAWAQAAHYAAALLLLPTAWLVVRRGEMRLCVGAAALIAFPPLVGFALGFLILHALPQTAARARAIGCADVLAYHRRMLPVTAAALAITALGAALVLRFDPSGVRALFAAIAALAVPHMIVPGLFTDLFWARMRPREHAALLTLSR